MKKQDIAKGALKVLANITEREVEKNTSKWPPRCMGFFSSVEKTCAEVGMGKSM